MPDANSKHWTNFALSAAKCLVKLENKVPSEGAVMFLTAMETLLEDVHNCPPGMIGAHLHVERTEDVHPDGIGQHIAKLEPVFFIDEAAELYGCPDEIRKETLQTIQEAWHYIASSLVLWKEVLSEIEKEEDKNTLIGAFKVSLMGCCHLRSFGLWHGNTTRGPRHLKEHERLTPWDTFSNFSQLNKAISKSSMLVAYDHFNQNGEWPEEE